MTIPSRTFIMRGDPYLPRLPNFLFPRTSESKEDRVVHDAKNKRNLIFGGDFNNSLTAASAPGGCYSYDPVLDLAGDSHQGMRVVSPLCHGPGNVTPCRPDDSQACGVDYKLNCFWVNPGGWRVDQDGTTCVLNGAGNALPAIPGSIYYTGLMRMDLTTGVWTGVSKAFDNAAENGNWDPVKRCLIWLDPSAGTIGQIFVDTVTSASTAIQPAALGTVVLPPGRLFGPGYLTATDWAIDIIGRWGYVVSIADVWIGSPPTPDHTETCFWRFNLDNPSIQQALADPPFGAHGNYQNLDPYGYPLIAPSPKGLRCQWDSRNRKVVWFYNHTPGGMIFGIGVYDPVTNTWMTFPITQDVPVGLNHITNNAHGYDSTNNVHILWGGQNAEDAEEIALGAVSTHYMLWRLA